MSSFADMLKAACRYFVVKVVDIIDRVVSLYVFESVCQLSSSESGTSNNYYVRK